MGDASASFVRTDVGDGGSLAELVSTVIQGKGHIDIVVNNATIAPSGRSHRRPSPHGI